MALMSIDNLRTNLSNPQRDYLWEFLCANPVANGSPETLLLRCQSTSIPGRSLGEILINFKQSAGYKLPGKIQYDHTIDTVFVEGEDHAIFDIIYNWKQSIINDKTNVGSGDSSIKTDIYLNLLTTAGDIAMRIRLAGCYPQAMPAQPLSYDSEAIVKYTVTWSYDWWEKVSS
jgi:hypothetical protein